MSKISKAGRIEREEREERMAESKKEGVPVVEKQKEIKTPVGRASLSEAEEMIRRAVEGALRARSDGEVRHHEMRARDAIRRITRLL